MSRSPMGRFVACASVRSREAHALWTLRDDRVAALRNVGQKAIGSLEQLDAALQLRSFRGYDRQLAIAAGQSQLTDAAQRQPGASECADQAGLVEGLRVIATMAGTAALRMQQTDRFPMPEHMCVHPDLHCGVTDPQTAHALSSLLHVDLKFYGATVCDGKSIEAIRR